MNDRQSDFICLEFIVN